jgi:hypothetical protein
MKSGDIAKFSEMQIGDYFSDTARQKYRKIPPLELHLPGQSPVILNAFHFQSNASLSVRSDSDWIFVAHATWTNEKSTELGPTIEEAELEHRLYFFVNYLETLEAALAAEMENASDGYYIDEAFGLHESDEFFSLLYSSFFVSLFSFLETQLNNECRGSQQGSPETKVSLNDIHGSGINRAKIYLVKVLNTSFQFDHEPGWEQIQWYNKIRNCIVHNNGIIADKNLLKYIESHNDLQHGQFFGDDYVILSANFCSEAVSVMGDFLRSLLYHRYADKIT